MGDAVLGKLVSVGSSANVGYAVVSIAVGTSAVGLGVGTY